MKFEFLEKLEEKYVFKTSHIFFLILVGISTLAVIVGLLFLLWGITPSFKPGVEKAEYPPPVAVAPDEIKDMLPIKATSAPKKSKVKIAVSKKETAQKTVVQNKETKTDPQQKIYEQSLDSLRTLIPQKYLWVNRGHYDYGSYKDRRGRWQYGKHWVIDNYGIPARLDMMFRNIQVKDFASKTSIVQSYVPVLVRFDEKVRYKVFNDLLRIAKNDITTTKNNISLLAQAANVFPVEKTNFLYKLVKFARKNPRDGVSFISYVNSVAPKFKKENREKVLDKMIAAYYKYYNDMGRQKEATEMFLTMLPKFEIKYQPLALANFYNLYENKNRDRRRIIENIDSHYRHELQRAESILRQKKMNKAGWRYKGLMGLGGGIVFIALIALLLSLLSIQRNIRELRTMMIKKEE